MSPNRRECGACPVQFWPVWCHASMPGRGLLCDRLARPDYVAYVERRTLDLDLLPPGEPTSPASPWVMALRAMRACPDHVAPACGCDEGRCARPDKIGPTDLIRCAACLGIELPTREAGEPAQSLPSDKRENP